MTREKEIRRKAAAYIAEKVGYYNHDDLFTRIARVNEDAFVDGAKWADTTLIDKAVKWLEYNFNLPSDFESHFRKAMK